MKHLMRLSLPILLIVFLLNNSTPAYAQLGVTTRLMVGGNPIDAGADAPSISNDGRYIVFESASTNVVANDTNSVTDIFRYDTQTATYIRVSVSSAGVQGNGNSITPIISGNGRYVAFRSDANNLVVNDSNGYSDVFLRDMQMNTTTRISVNSIGNPLTGSGIIMPYDISSDGQYVLMVSNKPDIVPNDTNNSWDIFLYDRQTGTTSRASVNGNGDQLDLGAVDGNLSDNGRYLAFSSSSPNLVANDTNNAPDAFVKDLQTGQVTRISVNSGGNQATYPGSVNFPFLIVDDISADGRYVTFASNADNLVANDTNGDAWDQFFHDRQTGQTKRISINNDGTQADGISGNGVISDDGRYVFFESFATNLVANDTNNAIDVFMFDNQTNSLSRISLTSVGGQTDGDSGVAALSADMRYVVMASDATNIVANDTNNARDIFIYDRLVLSAPTLISPANGFTTTNPNITFSWNSVAGASEYRIQFSSYEDFNEIFLAETVTTTTYNHTFWIAPDYLNIPVFWRVQAVYGETVSEWSSAGFTIKVPPPILITPINDAFLPSLTVNFSWSNVSNTTWYVIEISTDNFNTLIDNRNIHNTTSYTYTLPSNNVYYWRVKAGDYWNSTDWSQVGRFSAGGLFTPTLISPVQLHTTTNGNVTFSWNSVISATEYQIQIGDASFNFLKHDYTSTTTSTSYTFVEGGTYYWRVRAKNSAFNGAWSAMRSITIQARSAPTPISPEDNATVQNPFVTLTWQPVAGVTQYQLQISSSAGIQDYFLNATSYDFVLPSYGRLSWRVRIPGVPNGYWSYSRFIIYDSIPNTTGYVNRQNYDAGIIFKTNKQSFYAIEGYHRPNRALEYDFSGNLLRTIIMPNSLIYSMIVDISKDGRYIVSYSIFSNLEEYHLYDTQTGAITLWAQSNNNDIRSILGISDGGRYVAFSTLTSLVPEDAELMLPGYSISNHVDLYLYDRQTAQFRFVSKNAATNPFGGSNYGVFSSNEQYFAYIYSEGVGPDLSPDYGSGNLYLYHTSTGQVAAVNAPNGVKVNASGKLAFSADGRYLMFASPDSQLVPNDTNDSFDVFLYDTQTWQFTRISVGTGNIQTNNHSSGDFVSGDGRFVTFYSNADNLVSDDTNNVDLFVHDRQNGETWRVSEDVNGLSNFTEASIPYHIHHPDSYVLNNGQSIMYLYRHTSLHFSPTKFHSPVATPPSPSPLGGMGGTTNPNATFSWAWMFESNRYELQIATDDAFTNIIHTDNYVHAMSYNYTLPSNGTYYWRVRGVNQLGAGAWSVNRLVLGIGANTLMDEQQLFNAMQPHLTNGLTFALFDVTANGILTTLQFSDGAVVTGTIKLVVQNGLLRITVEGISGGNGIQQATMRDTLPSLIMTMLDETLPDDYLGIESLSMTTSAVNLGVVLPNP